MNKLILATFFFFSCTSIKKNHKIAFANAVDSTSTHTAIQSWSNKDRNEANLQVEKDQSQIKNNYSRTTTIKEYFSNEFDLDDSLDIGFFSKDSKNSKSHPKVRVKETLVLETGYIQSDLNKQKLIEISQVESTKDSSNSTISQSNKVTQQSSAEEFTRYRKGSSATIFLIAIGLVVLIFLIAIKRQY